MNEDKNEKADLQTYDLVVLGGGPAGIYSGDGLGIRQKRGAGGQTSGDRRRGHQYRNGAKQDTARNGAGVVGV